MQNFVNRIDRIIALENGEEAGKGKPNKKSRAEMKYELANAKRARKQRKS